MKKNTLQLIVLVLLLVLPSCKKPYPNDIPGWLKSKIDYCKKKKNDCNSLQVQELKCDGELVYLLSEDIRASDHYLEYRNYDGNILCSGDNILPDTCGFCPLTNLIYERSIWRE